MRKSLGFALSLALSSWSAAPAQAQILKNLTTTGELDIQGRSISNATDLSNANPDFSGSVGTRLMGGLNFDVTDGAGARISVYKNNRVWGQTQDTLQTLQNNVQIGEANVTLRNVFGLNQTLGRQYFGEQGDLLIYFGPTADHVFGLPVSGIDAWRADWRGDQVRVTALVAKQQSSVPGFGALSPSDTDLDLQGIEAMFSQLKAANVGLRLYQQVINHDTNVAPANVHLLFADVTFKGEPAENLHYKAEFLKNFGQSPMIPDGTGKAIYATAAGFGMLANADYRAESGAGVLKIVGEFGYGSGDRTPGDGTDSRLYTIASDYRPGLIWGGLSNFSLFTPGGLGIFNAPGLSGELNQGSGLTTVNFGGEFSPAALEKLWLGAHYYYFSQTDDITPAQTGKGIGSEVDLTATWKQSDNVKIRFGYAWFLPKDSAGYLFGQAIDNIKMGIADATVRF